MQNTDPVYGGDTITNFNLTEENRRLLSTVLQLDAKLAVAQQACLEYDRKWHASQQNKTKLLTHIEQLREALDYLKTEKVDYMVLNKLGDPYAEHGTMLAIKALAATPAQSLENLREQVKLHLTWEQPLNTK